MNKNSNLEIILSVFGQFGYDPSVDLSKPQMLGLLNDIATANSSIGKIEKHILEELWETGSDSDQLISINKLAKVITKALKSLKDEHDALQIQINQSKTLGERKELLLELYTVSHYYQILALPFRIQKLFQSPLIFESLKLVPEKIKNKEKYIFSFEPTEETIGLKIILWLAMLLLGLEVLMMFHKEHFYTLLCLCMVLSIFMLNYFDAKFVCFIIGNLFFSTFLDLIWEISNAKRYWNKQGDDFICFQHSNILKFSTMFILLIAVGKLMIAGILFKYRNNPPNLCVNLQFLQLRFSLDADPKNNPLSKLF